MCGIVGYIGHRDAYPIIIKGLQRLEYRGYDSAGVALYDGNSINLSKTKGKVDDLKSKSESTISLKGSLGIGHTRWATHGVPNDVNSHPHLSNSGELVIIHNGIIENYDSIKKELIKRGYTFHSDTDTEVLVNLIEEVKNQEGVKLGKAVQIALNQVVGAYAIAVFDVKKPDEIVVAKLGSPLAIGIGQDEFFIASDASPFIEFTNNAMYLEDEEMAIIRLGKEIKLRKIKDDSVVYPNIKELQLNIEEIEKGGYDHFMLKEIYEQPRAILDTYRGRLLADKGLIKMAGVDENIEKSQWISQRFKGIGVYAAADLKLPSGVTLVNPDTHLLEIGDASAEFIVDFRLEKGYGYYSMVFLRAREEKSDDTDVNLLLIDNDFKAVEYVTYAVEEVIDDFA